LQNTLRQDVGFFDQKGTGSISIQVTTNCNLVNTGISEKLGLGIQGTSTFFAAFIIAFVVQWKLTLITMAIVPTIMIIISICVVIDVKQEGRILPIYAEAGQLAEEVISSMKTVHAFWASPCLSEKYLGLLKEAKKEGMKKSPNFGVLFSIEYFSIHAGYALAFWQGVRMYASGEIQNSGDVVT
jgi:ATP-binding cassette subfamily B (MDR/TAP) protein 1